MPISTSNGFPSWTIVVINVGELPETFLGGMIAGADVIVGWAFLRGLFCFVPVCDAHFVISWVISVWIKPPFELEVPVCCSPRPC